MATYGQSVTYRDSKGQTATMRFFVANATDAGAKTAAQAVIAAINPLTNCAEGSALGAFTRAPVPNDFGTTDNYKTVEMKAQVTFQTNTGALHRYMIPAPIEDLFEADGETVKTPDAGGDAQQILLQNLVDAVVGDVCSRDGVVMNSYVGGIFVAKHLKRRFNIFTRNPQLTGPGE